MARVVIFIGPAGGGKSSICEEIYKESNYFKHIKLDDLSGNHEEKINKGKQEILDYERRDNELIYLIDVGAFFQHYIDSPFWKKRKNQMICVYNNPEFCYKNYFERRGKPRKSEEEYLKKEFCEQRRLLYNLAYYKIVTDKKKNESVKEVMTYINKILNKN